MEYLNSMNHRRPQMVTRPLTDLEVLMQQAPGSQDPRLASIASTKDLKETVGAAVDALEPEDRYIIEQLLMQGNSLRKLGYVLGIPKTSLARRRDRICEQLKNVLSGDPAVSQWTRN
tara:strand:- start:157 stop:507 length:351 start_codon:yes stop_codon:yes gene_type:complete